MNKVEVIPGVVYDFSESDRYEVHPCHGKDKPDCRLIIGTEANLMEKFEETWVDFVKSTTGSIPSYVINKLQFRAGYRAGYRAALGLEENGDG